jgi:hypothetical protein
MRYVHPKRRFTFNGLHGAASQKIVLFISTAVTTSNPTFLSILISIQVADIVYRTAYTYAEFFVYIGQSWRQKYGIYFTV